MGATVIVMARKYKSVSECPSKLEDLILEVNLVPFGVITPEFKAWQDIELRRLREETGDPSPVFSSYEFLRKLITHLPEDFLKHLESRASEYAYDDSSFKRYYIKQYVEYCEMRDSMLWFVRRIEEERQGMRAVEIKHQLKEGSLTYDHYQMGNWDSDPIIIKTALKRNDSGKLYTTGLAPLIGKFDEKYLRRCATCLRIFLAKDIRHQTCGDKKCAERLGNKKRLNEAKELKQKQNNHFQSRVKK